jgi:hypothetical protein
MPVGRKDNKMTQQYQHYINHISLVVDKSGSMQGQPVVKVFDREIEYLKRRSVELDQETRISIYLFDDTVECLTFDMDVMRFKSLEGYYRLGGSTALIDAVLRAAEDNKKLPELYGDHAFLQYVITDGQENASKRRPDALQTLLKGLPDNWTTACLVPNATGANYAERFGFNGGSISIWDTNAAGAFDKVGAQFSKTIDNYMAMRSTGVRGTKGLFTLDTKNVSKSALREVPSVYYDIYPVRQESAIKDYVESWTGEKYRVGSTYHQPVKPIKIQDYKNILLQDVRNGKVYEGDNLRQLLGLPAQTAEVNPGSHKDWRIFVQSTSSNRKLFPETFILVRK